MAEMKTARLLAGYLHEVALNTQDAVILDTSSPSAAAEAYQIATTSNRLVSCPLGELKLDKAFALSEQVQKAVANTSQRWATLDDLSELINGRVFPAPDCDQPAPPRQPPTNLWRRKPAVSVDNRRQRSKGVGACQPQTPGPSGKRPA